MDGTLATGAKRGIAGFDHGSAIEATEFGQNLQTSVLRINKIVGIALYRHAAMSDPTSDSNAETASKRIPGPIAKAFYVLMALPTLAFTGYNLWRLTFDGEIWIRNEGRFVRPEYDLYFWVTLSFYIVMFFVSSIVLALFFAWAIGKLRRRG